MLLDKVNSPKDIKRMSYEELSLLSNEIRELIIDVVSKMVGILLQIWV